ncbi:MAG TPA: hypothetical protein VJ809_12380 [Pirellulales bacterium]|nr:hypothetical protein [Pirellulales bacterium]
MGYDKAPWRHWLEFCKSESAVVLRKLVTKLFGGGEWQVGGFFRIISANRGLSGKKSADSIGADRSLAVDGEGLTPITASRRPGSFCNSERNRFSGINHSLPRCGFA